MKTFTQMAEIRNQLFKIEQSDELFKSASVSFEISFTTREISENIAFGVFILLMERDEEFEKYSWVLPENVKKC